MAFVEVRLVVHDKTYSVEVDEDANPQALVKGFVNRLSLPKQQEYRLHLVDALKIHEGATLSLVEVKPEDLFRGLKEETR